MKNYKYVLKGVLSQDAFEICNLLGVSKKKLKIVVVYMILINLHPYLRSKVNNIKLVNRINELNEKICFSISRSSCGSC